MAQVAVRDEERAELLNSGNKNDFSTSSDSDNDMPYVFDCDLHKVLGFVRDLVISVAFWWFLLFFDASALFGYGADPALLEDTGHPMSNETKDLIATQEKQALEFSENFGNGLLIVTGVLMVLWRLHRAFFTTRDTGGVDIPYTTAYFKSDGKEMFLVATLHISPKAPLDVQAVMETSNCDVVMIELDEERLDRMREPDYEAVVPKQPKPEDLQPIVITGSNGPMTVRAQRAVWNAEWAGDEITGNLAVAMVDEEQNHGRDLQGKMAIVQRGTPFVLMAHNLYNRGASAVLIVNKDDDLPLGRIGGSDRILNDLQMVRRTWNCGFPPVPLLLLPKNQGRELEDMCNNGSAPHVTMAILDDHYPRRTLRLRVCQACSLMCTGIGVLYGIIQCFNIEVGAEFTIAEVEAKKRGIPCACIDVDLNRFWARLGGSVIPTPCNLFNSFWCWLCFPRIMIQALFPPPGNVDVAGSMVLHACSFSLRTWFAFILAGVCASQITNWLLWLLGYGASKAVEQAGGVEAGDHREILQSLMMLGVQMYILPQVYTSIAASRDEAMYRAIVKKSRDLAKKRMVVVVGAAHSNGILQRARDRGL